ncbi:hypothetical protein NKR19_g6045 [Coniochaeta hoffmannii]|uniref:P-loop containing nucleoside triphosphate hydrolase protein n=1 Tax=Coniochaeta hoffmannii TaxID=91930 RepID=A0AA38VR00_9PEZI|nr:hypothetical protein NKR19_g6045 [Coniochaeta hoffmannii]
MPTQQTLPRKFIIQMSGAPGSGKSTVAGLIGRSTGAVVIDHDRLRSALIAPEPNPDGVMRALPFEQAARLAYGLQWDLVRDLAQRQGHSVVVDSTCNFREVLDRGSSCAARSQHGHAYWYVECRVPVGDIDLLDRRLRAREHPMPSQRTAVDRPPRAAGCDADGDGGDGTGGEDQRVVFRKWMTDPCRPEEEDNVIILDSTAHPEKLRDQVLARILG